MKYIKRVEDDMFGDFGFAYTEVCAVGGCSGNERVFSKDGRCLWVIVPKSKDKVIFYGEYDCGGKLFCFEESLDYWELNESDYWQQLDDLIDDYMEML